MKKAVTNLTTMFLYGTLALSPIAVKPIIPVMEQKVQVISGACVRSYSEIIKVKGNWIETKFMLPISFGTGLIVSKTIKGE